MRFQKLQFLAYGPFTDSSLDLSHGNHGLHIVYGPNEAGKSSALRAIQGLMFGIPTRCPDNHLHDYKKLRVGAIIRSFDGQELEFVRRKANKRSILNPRQEQGTAFPDDILKPFVGGIDGETFQRVYGIGHNQLRQGGDDMKSLKGLVGESLFAATIGGSGLATLITKLDSEATEIYDSSKRTAKIKVAEKQYKQLQKEKREARLAATEWAKLQSDLEIAQAHRDHIIAKSTNLKTQLNRMQRIQQGMGIISRRRKATETIERLGAVVVLPDAYDTTKRINVESDLKRVQNRLAELDSMLTGPSSLCKQIEQINVPEGLLNFEDAINELQDQRAVHIKAQGDQASLHRDCENAEMRATQLMRELGLSGSLADAEQFRLTPDQRTKTQALANDEKSLRNAPDRIQQQVVACESELQVLRKKRKQLGESNDLSAIELAVNQVLQMGDVQQDLDSASILLAAAESEAQQELQTLDLWSGTIEETLTIRVPLSETVHRFSQEFDELQIELRSLAKELTQLERDLVIVNEAIAALVQAGHLPTESELQDLRALRDQRWRGIRQAGTIVDEDANEYELTIVNADNVADRLRREADRVSQLAQRRAAAESLESQLHQTRVDIQSLQSEHDSLTAKWKTQWHAAGISSPLPPDEMRAWLAKLHDIQRQARDMTAIASDVNRHRQRIETARQQLLDASSGRVDSLSAEWPLRKMIDHVQSQLTREKALDEQRTALDREIDQMETKLAKLNSDRTTAIHDLDKWLQRWRPAMKRLGLDDSATAEQANVRMSSIQGLFEIANEIEGKQKRIQDIQSDSAKFEAAAKRLADRFLSADSDLPAAEIALTLRSRLVKARNDIEKLTQLEKQLQAARNEFTKTKEAERDLQRQIDELMSLAATTNCDELPQIERDSNEMRECQNRLRDLDEQLHNLCGGNSIDDFINEATEADHDELSVQISEVEKELEMLEKDRDQAVLAVNEHQSKVDAADGNARAAELDQESIGIISRMHGDARHYMQLKIAHRLLRQQIEAHRAENEDPLLGRASSLFARLTCDEFSGIRTDYDGDHPVIVGIRNGTDEVVTVEAMSDGTRDQLYLALRLAYVEKQLVSHEPMPFIVDDILVHFDDSRSLATLEVLAEISDQTQVIFFTHHRHLAELAVSNLSADTCFVHHLDSRGREVATSSSITSSR